MQGKRQYGASIAIDIPSHLTVFMTSITVGSIVLLLSKRDPQGSPIDLAQSLSVSLKHAPRGWSILRGITDVYVMIPCGVGHCERTNGRG